MAKSYNTEPYYDDFDSAKGFHRILFRPGYAVQARELTQLQTILQNQITKFGNHMFKEGSMVIPGEASIDTKIDYVKLEPSYGGVLTDTLIANFLGKTVRSTTNNLTAEVIWYTKSTSSESAALYVRYKTAADDNTTKVFGSGDIIEDMDGVYTVQAISLSATGKGSIASIKEGVYFLKGCFVHVPAATIILDKFTNTPSYRIGLKVSETETTAEEDETLFDNAQNSFNYAAPGAHRYTIVTDFVALPIDSESDTDFIELIRTGDGQVKKQVNQTEYSVLAREFAHRTYDESGNYTVKNFEIDVREYRDNNRGSWIDNKVYLSGDVVVNGGKYYVARNSGTSSSATPPTHTAGTAYDGPGNTGIQWEYTDYPRYNRGIYKPADDDTLATNQSMEAKLAIGLEPGKAYVQGYEIEKVGTEYVAVDKSRDNVQVNNEIIPATVGSYIRVTNLYGAPPLVSTNRFATVSLYNRIQPVGSLPTTDPCRLIVGTASVNTTTDVLTYNSHGLKTGDQVVYNNGGSTSITGLTSGNTYYVINVDVNNFKVATTYALAIAGTAVDLTGTGNAAQYFAIPAIGTARVRFIELESGVYGSQTAIYKLGLFDIQMTGSFDFNKNVKSVFYDNASGAEFSANYQPELLRYTSSVTSYTSNTYATQGSGTFLLGAGASFQTDLEVGDYILIQGTDLRRVVSIDSQTKIQIDSAVNYIGSYYEKATSKVYEPEKVSLLFPLSQSSIKSVTSADGTNDTIYTVYETFTGSVSSGLINISTSSGTMSSAADSRNYLVIDTTTGQSVLWTSVTPAGAGATIAVNVALNGHAVVVVAAVNKTGSTLTRKSKSLISGATKDFTTQSTAQSKSLFLGKADGYRLISVKMKSGTFASPGSTYSIDITDRYEFDNGQRATHYDQARLILKGSYAPPEAPIQVTFDYFTHATGDYFTVDSYPTNVEYKAIPLYNGVSLGDYIDFRPRIDDAGSTFTGTGASYSLIPKRGIDVYADYSYYLGRKVKIAVDFAGNFFAVNGVPSLNPGEPLDPSLGLVLYGLTLEPYTYSTSSNSVQIQRYDNKRYTMRDIGKLEKRIDNLEYYTSLSLLEQQTESSSVLDSSGLERFKNGFIVDSFTGHNTGDSTSPDYNCSVDMENGELRPFFSMHNVNLLEKATSNTARAASNYHLYGDVITLPVVDHVAIIKQDFASRLENINPFAVFTFLGDVKLNPSSDDWFEVDRRPDLVIDVEGNFSTIKNMAERSGVLGTIWNAWQTQWTGAPISKGQTVFLADRGGLGLARGSNMGWMKSNITVDEIEARFGSGAVQSGAQRRAVTVETVAMQIGQSRTGTKTTLVSKIDRQVVGDRVLSTAAIPYIRSRNVLVQIQKLKPNTRFYPFFDGVNISDYVTPASTITYTPVSGTFDTDTNVGGLAAGTARLINNDSQVCLNRGDVITGAVSGATAVVVGKEYNPDTLAYSLKVVNVKGTFSATETISGSVSSATGTVLSYTASAQGNSLITNFSGEIQLLFTIPNNDSLRFRCGTRELKLVDVSTADGQFTSRARANYRAEGILETRQQTVHAVRNAELVEEQLVDNRVIMNTADRVVADTGWYDPLAQTFLIEQKGGCFLSKIDVFFATKDDKIPVTVEIRECVNGYPGKRVLPFSRVTLNPSQVSLSANTVPMDDGSTANKYDTATTFNFPSPVYVQENTEYALVLSSDSNAYKVWVSQIGDTMPGTARTISDQPYLGSLFKSQNASTWTAVQTQDLKFRIYRAKFDTEVVANIEYVNDVIPQQTLELNPFETRNGVNKIRVWQKDHGFPPISAGGTFVTITTTNDAGTGTITASTSSTTVTGVGTAFTTQLVAGSCLYKTDGTFIGKVSSIASATSLTLAANASVAVSAGTAFQYKAPVNGIPANEIFTTHTVQSAGMDLDSYILNTTTSATASGYNGGTGIRASRHYQYDAIQPAVTMQTFSETPVEFGVKTITGKSVHSTTQQAYTPDTDFSGVLINETNYFGVPKMVASTYNEQQNISSNKSLSFNVTMSSSNNALSPIIDSHRTSVIVINNKIDNPTETTVNVANLDYNTVISALTTVAFTSTGSVISSTDANTQAALATLSVGKYITITGAANSGNNSTFLVTSVATGGTSITVSGTLTTEAAGSAVTIKQRERFVNENAPTNSGTYSKYVTRKIKFASANKYVRINFAVNLPSEANVEVWYRTNPIGSTVDFDTIPYTQIASPDATIKRTQNESGQFVDATYSTSSTAFDAIQVKLVMKSSNSSQVPRIKDLRVICCA